MRYDNDYLGLIIALHDLTKLLQKNDKKNMPKEHACK